MKYLGLLSFLLLPLSSFAIGNCYYPVAQIVVPSGSSATHNHYKAPFAPRHKPSHRRQTVTVPAVRRHHGYPSYMKKPTIRKYHHGHD